MVITLMNWTFAHGLLYIISCKEMIPILVIYLWHFQQGVVWVKKMATGVEHPMNIPVSNGSLFIGLVKMLKWLPRKGLC